MRASLNAYAIAPLGIGVFLWLTLLFATAPASAAEIEPARVLVMHSFRSTLVATSDWYGGIEKGLRSDPGMNVEIEVEAPDLSRYNGQDYVRDLIRVYRQKYSIHRPHLIIATYTHALQFLLDHGEELFPGIPVVFSSATSDLVHSRPMPAHITGIAALRDIAGTLQLALRLHPGSKRVAMIIGSGEMDQSFSQIARAAAKQYEDIAFVWLEGLPPNELTVSVQQLPEDTIILFVSQFENRTGKAEVPKNVVQSVASLDTHPVYGLWDTLLGGGVVGGRMATLAKDGFTAGTMALRILKGEAPAQIPIIDRKQNIPIVDWRALRRWNIDENLLPANSRISYREPPLWGQYQWEITSAALVILAQGLLIFFLFLNRAKLRGSKRAYIKEHKLREEAETTMWNLKQRVSQFSKERSLGAVASTIAHEINQPLIAIQNYSQAATRRLESDEGSNLKARELLQKIQAQAGRAGGIINHIRMLFDSGELVLGTVQIAHVIKQVIKMMEIDLQSTQCKVIFKDDENLPPVLGDALQIQLVLVNLLRNAVHTMPAETDKSERLIRIEVHPAAQEELTVVVADSGPGIAPESLDDLFEPFSSGGMDGMGLGLNICLSIIEAHGGRIWHEPSDLGGAMFQFTLRVA